MLTADAYTLSPERLVAAAQRILDDDLCCSLEACVDPVTQRWESRAILLHRHAGDVAVAITEWLLRDDGADWRLRGYPRSFSGRPENVTLLIHAQPIPTRRAAEPTRFRHRGVRQCWCAMA